jgi:hypothetical protein
MVRKEKSDGKDREERAGKHLRLHERRLPLRALHLQELQLLT